MTTKLADLKKRLARAEQDRRILRDALADIRAMNRNMMSPNLKLIFDRADQALLAATFAEGQESG